jgi:hypothetical protein
MFWISGKDVIQTYDSPDLGFSGIHNPITLKAKTANKKDYEINLFSALLHIKNDRILTLK